VPRSDLRHYSLCRVCGTKIPHTGETSAAAVPAEQTSSGTPASLGPTDGG
jgi:hypothetical protein